MKKRIIIAVSAAILTIAVAIGLAGCTSPTKSTLGGVPIKEYSIVYSDADHDYSLRAAEYIRDSIEEVTGCSLPLIEDDETSESGYEIVVGETSREISERLDAECEGLEFAILGEEKQVALEGDYFIIAAAAYYFIETYFPENNYDAAVPSGVSVHEPIVKEAKNYIMLIGDGMGLYQTKLFDYLTDVSDYSDGENTFYGYMLPYSGFARTNSLSGVTDSAAAGTALSCGTKTNNSCVGQLPDGTNLQSLTELAMSLGKKAGVMSTEGSTGATPSAFTAHTSSRDNKSDIQDCQIEFEYLKGGLLECSFDRYDASGIAHVEKRITDSLARLKNENGFFLMYEEAHVDKHSHSNNIDKTFLALIRFNQAIARFMEFAFYNPDTFIIITADHETGSLLPTDGGTLAYGSGDHSGADVPVFAYGYGAEVFDGVTVENIQIPQTIASYWGVDDFGDQSNYGRLNK